MRIVPQLTRIAAVGALALVGAGLTALPSTAESGDIDYACEWAVGESTGEGDATASWNSAIPDDGKLVVDVGDRVTLDPYTGSITLPDGFVDALRASERTELDVFGLQLTIVDETGEPYIIELEVEQAAIPAQGPMTIAVDGVRAGRVSTREPGTVTLLAIAFYIAEGDLDQEEEPSTYLSCDVAGDESEAVVDTFTVRAAAEPVPTVTVTVTPTPTVTVTPVRPVLVQTDAPETSGGGSGYLAAAGVGAGLLLLGGRRLARRPARRH